MRVIACAWLVVTSLCIGCGDSSTDGAHLAGRVTLQGKELPADAEGFITFTQQGAAKDEKPVTVPVTASRYDSPNTPTGKVKVYFDISRKTGPVKKSERTGTEYQDVVNLVPQQYATGIEIDVSGDKTDQDFSL